MSDITPPIPAYEPICSKCNEAQCAWYGPVGGYSVWCKICNAEQATRRRKSYAKRKKRLSQDYTDTGKVVAWTYKKWGNGVYDFYANNRHAATVYNDLLAKKLIADCNAKKINLIPPTDSAR